MNAETAFMLFKPHAYFYSLGNVKLLSQNGKRTYRLSAEAIVLFSQLLYWTDHTKDPDGWVFKKREDWVEELGISERCIESARAELRSVGLIEELKRGVPCTVNYRVNFDKFTEYMNMIEKDVPIYIEAGVLKEDVFPTKGNEEAATQEPPVQEVPFTPEFLAFWEKAKEAFPKALLYKTTGAPNKYALEVQEYLKELYEGTFCTKHKLKKTIPTPPTEDEILEAMKNCFKREKENISTAFFHTNRDGSAPKSFVVDALLSGIKKPSEVLEVVTYEELVANKHKYRVDFFYDTDYGKEYSSGYVEPYLEDTVRPHGLRSTLKGFFRHDPRFYSFYKKLIDYYTDLGPQIWESRGLKPPKDFMIDILRYMKIASNSDDERFRHDFGWFMENTIPGVWNNPNKQGWETLCKGVAWEYKNHILDINKKLVDYNTFINREYSNRS